jgi:hypothetical protein
LAGPDSNTWREDAGNQQNVGLKPNLKGFQRWQFFSKIMTNVMQIMENKSALPGNIESDRQGG